MCEFHHLPFHHTSEEQERRDHCPIQAAFT
jgi:hypothetical protein